MHCPLKSNSTIHPSPGGRSQRLEGPAPNHYAVPCAARVLTPRPQGVGAGRGGDDREFNIRKFPPISATFFELPEAFHNFPTIPAIAQFSTTFQRPPDINPSPGDDRGVTGPCPQLSTTTVKQFQDMQRTLADRTKESIV